MVIGTDLHSVLEMHQALSLLANVTNCCDSFPNIMKGIQQEKKRRSLRDQTSFCRNATNQRLSKREELAKKTENSQRSILVALSNNSS